MQAAHPHCAMCRSVTAKGTPGESEPQTVWARASKQCQQQATRSADLVFLCSGLRPDTNTDTDTDTDTECCRCATTLQDVCAMRGQTGRQADRQTDRHTDRQTHCPHRPPRSSFGTQITDRHTVSLLSGQGPGLVNVLSLLSRWISIHHTYL